MHKQEIYNKIKRESAERKLNFQSLERDKGGEFGFTTLIMLQQSVEI